MKWDASTLRSFILNIIQPLKVGKTVEQKGTQASLDNLYPDGFNDKFRMTSPFGVNSRMPKGITAFYDSLFGSQHEQIITSILHQERPEATGVGETVFYSTDESGDAVKVKMTLTNDGILRIDCPKDFIVNCINQVVMGTDFTIDASDKTTINSPKVDIGDSGLEKVINGETFQPFYDRHSHYDSFGLPVSPPLEPMIPATYLSQKVKAAK